MKIKLIPAGEFLVGSQSDEPGRSEDVGSQQKVRITKTFNIGVTEVMQGQWVSVLGTKPSKRKEYVKEGDNYSAVYVSQGEIAWVLRHTSLADPSGYD